MHSPGAARRLLIINWLAAAYIYNNFGIFGSPLASHGLELNLLSALIIFHGYDAAALLN